MCGISGIFNKSSLEIVDPLALERMCNSLTHRGPDETKLFIKNHIGLAFNRLSIVDIETGSQPLISSSKRYTIIFNGEIFNYQELRTMLDNRGYEFTTNSEAEVIIALFELGYDSPENHLRGMFAFALYDNFNDQLTLSRDRLGEKPLFWAKTNQGFIFASEIKSLLASKLINKSPNWQKISDYLTYGYTPQDNNFKSKTAFNNIFHIQPGHRLIISDEIHSVKWWDFPSYKERDKNISLNWEDDLFKSIKNAIKYRMKSDTPIGLFLSGGIDSGLILATLSEIGIPKNFKTFTAIFEEEDFSEASQASLVADHFSVENIQLKIKPQDMIESFSDIVYHSDNLIANPAIIPNYILSKKASKHVKSVLNGGGADELFFGYPTYIVDSIFRFIPPLNSKLINLVDNSVSYLPNFKGRYSSSYLLSKIIKGLSLEQKKRHFNWRTIFTELDKQKLLNSSFSGIDSYLSYKSAYSRFRGDDNLQMYSYSDMNIWWQSMGLYQGDVISMANSLEVRMPFMDHELINLVSTIPRKKLFKGFKRKAILRKYLHSIAPDYKWPKSKNGFHVPLSNWFKGPLKSFVHEKLSYQNLKAIPFINNREVSTILSQHEKGSLDNSYKIMNLLVLVEWYKRYFL